MTNVFFGALDPDAVFQLGCLRTGSRHALLEGGGPKLDIAWGIDRRIVRAVRERARTLEPRTTALPWLERKYWKLVSDSFRTPESFWANTHSTCWKVE